MGIGLLSLIPVAADDEGRVRMPAWMRTVILVGALTITSLVILSTGPGRALFQLSHCPPRWCTLLAIAAA